MASTVCVRFLHGELICRVRTSITIGRRYSAIARSQVYVEDPNIYNTPMQYIHLLLAHLHKYIHTYIRLYINGFGLLYVVYLYK